MSRHNSVMSDSDSIATGSVRNLRGRFESFTTVRSHRTSILSALEIGGEESSPYDFPGPAPSWTFGRNRSLQLPSPALETDPSHDLKPHHSAPASLPSSRGSIVSISLPRAPRTVSLLATVSSPSPPPPPSGYLLTATALSFLPCAHGQGCATVVADTCLSPQAAPPIRDPSIRDSPSGPTHRRGVSWAFLDDSHDGNGLGVDPDAVLGPPRGPARTGSGSAWASGLISSVLLGPHEAVPAADAQQSAEEEDVSGDPAVPHPEVASSGAGLISAVTCDEADLLKSLAAAADELLGQVATGHPPPPEAPAPPPPRVAAALALAHALAPSPGPGLTSAAVPKSELAAAKRPTVARLLASSTPSAPVSAPAAAYAYASSSFSASARRTQEAKLKVPRPPLDSGAEDTNESVVAAAGHGAGSHIKCAGVALSLGPSFFAIGAFCERRRYIPRSEF